MKEHIDLFLENERQEKGSVELCGRLAQAQFLSSDCFRDELSISGKRHNPRIYTPYRL